MKESEDFEARSGAPDAAAVLDALDRTSGSPCPVCAAALCGHDVVASLVCGYKADPRCLACTADDMQLGAAELAERVWLFVRGRECFRSGWTAASLREAVAAEGVPDCLHARTDNRPSQPRDLRRDAADPSDPADETWDAGALACGDLLLELRRRLRSGGAGRTFLLIALDASAPEDIPAWCKLTGNGLLRAEHPRYWLRAKG